MYKYAVGNETQVYGIGENVTCPNNCTSAMNGECTSMGCVCASGYGHADCSYALNGNVTAYAGTNTTASAKSGAMGQVLFSGLAMVIAAVMIVL